MIHIVFNLGEINLMQEVIKMDDSLQGEVLQVKDDFAVGPLAGLDTEEGWQQRISWWNERLKGSPYESSARGFDDRETIRELKSSLDNDPAQELWIWMGQNQHDVCSYYWLIPQLSDYPGRVMVLYLNNLPFISDKGNIFYPAWLHEIPPREFLKAKKLARPVTPGEFEVDGDEWKKLCIENAPVRILEGGKKIVGREENFYDKEIIANLSSEWQKATRLLTNTLHRMKTRTGDVFLMWRLKQLVREGKIAVMGDMEKGWKEFDVKKPEGVQSEISFDKKEGDSI
jgi:hypothetical protein